MSENAGRAVKAGGPMSFEHLEVFKRAYRISLDIHSASLTFPDIEQRALADQIRREANPFAPTWRRDLQSNRFRKRNSDASWEWRWVQPMKCGCGSGTIWTVDMWTKQRGLLGAMNIGQSPRCSKDCAANPSSDVCHLSSEW